MAGAPLRVAPDDSRLTWRGVVALERGDGWVRPWRLPPADRLLFPPELVRLAAQMSYGGRLVFRSDTTAVAGGVAPFDVGAAAEADGPGAAALLAPCLTEATAVDLCCDGRRVATASLAGRTGFAFAGLPAGAKRLELWLPQYAPFRLTALELDSGAALTPDGGPEAAQPRWIAYGSSLTMAYPPVAHPSETWTARVAGVRGLDHLVLGFPGGCHLEPALARLIRDLPAEYVSLEVALNALRAASLSPRTYASALIGFVLTVRDGHPDAPVVVQSPVYVPEHDAPDGARAGPNAVGFTLPAMRAETAAAVERLRAHGDRRLHYVDGLRIYGPEHAALSPDGIHPNAEGQQVLAAGFLREVVHPYFR
jgi:hypothetical protein